MLKYIGSSNIPLSKDEYFSTYHWFNCNKLYGEL